MGDEEPEREREKDICFIMKLVGKSCTQPTFLKAINNCRGLFYTIEILFGYLTVKSFILVIWITVSFFRVIR